MAPGPQRRELKYSSLPGVVPDVVFLVPLLFWFFELLFDTIQGFLLQQSWKSKVSTYLTNPAAVIIPTVSLFIRILHTFSASWSLRPEEKRMEMAGMGSRGEGPFPGRTGPFIPGQSGS